MEKKGVSMKTESLLGPVPRPDRHEDRGECPSRAAVRAPASAKAARPRGRSAASSGRQPFPLRLVIANRMSHYSFFPLTCQEVSGFFLGSPCEAGGTPMGDPPSPGGFSVEIRRKKPYNNAVK